MQSGRLNHKSSCVNGHAGDLLCAGVHLQIAMGDLRQKELGSGIQIEDQKSAFAN